MAENLKEVELSTGTSVYVQRSAFRGRIALSFDSPETQSVYWLNSEEAVRVAKAIIEMAEK